MLINTEINKRAWEIRRLAAKKWDCKIMAVSWKHCLRLAKYRGPIGKVWEREVEKQQTKQPIGKVIYEKSATKQTLRKKRGRPCKNPSYIPFIEKLISNGNMSRKQIMAATLRKYPDLKKSSLSVTISNCGNPEKTRLTGGRVFAKDESGFLTFA